MERNLSEELLINKFGIDPEVLDLVGRCEKELEENFRSLDDITEYNQYKVLSAFQENRTGDNHFAWNTGYGYDDPGREAIETI